MSSLTEAVVMGSGCSCDVVDGDFLSLALMLPSRRPIMSENVVGALKVEARGSVPRKGEIWGKMAAMRASREGRMEPW